MSFDQILEEYKKEIRRREADYRQVEQKALEVLGTGQMTIDDVLLRVFEEVEVPKDAAIRAIWEMLAKRLLMFNPDMTISRAG